MDLKVAATFLVAMYVVSGLVKVQSMGTSEAKRLAGALNITLKTATALVLIAGLVELIGSYLVIEGVWKTDNSKVKRGTGILAVFTVLATLIFYARPLKYKPLLSNMTALAALLLLPKVCELAHK